MIKKITQSSFLQSHSTVIIAISTCLLLAPCIWLGVAQLTSSQTPNKALLGTWKKVSYTEGGVVTDLSLQKNTDYIGFVTLNEGDFVRRYHTKDTPESVYSLRRYTFLSSSSSPLTLLEYAYSDSDKQERIESFGITFPSRNEMVIQRVGKDGYPLMGEVASEARYKRVGDAPYEASKNFVRTASVAEEICKNITQGGKVYDQPILLPLSCNLVLGSDSTASVMTYHAYGDVVFSYNGTTVFTLANAMKEGVDVGTPRVQLFMSEGDGPFLNQQAIEFVDINYDGYSDLKVLSLMGAYNASYDYYVYDPTKKTFIPTPILSDVVNASEDGVKKTVSSFSKGRGIGDLYIAKVYQFLDGKYLFVREESQDFATADCDEVETTCTYRHVIRELRKGVMVIIKDEILKMEDVYGGE